MQASLARRLVSEGLGTAILLAAVVGSGIMAAKLSGGNGAIALLCNTLATGAILTVLILMFGPVSGAHFNPAVSIAFVLRGELPWREVGLLDLPCRSSAACSAYGPRISCSSCRSGNSPPPRAPGRGNGSRKPSPPSAWCSRFSGCLAQSPAAVPYAVGLYITSAYWFTASTSFANPAVTIARSLSDTFAGIAPGDVAAFIVAQMIGMLVAVGLARWLFRRGQ